MFHVKLMIMPCAPQCLIAADCSEDERLSPVEFTRQLREDTGIGDAVDSDFHITGAASHTGRRRSKQAPGSTGDRPVSRSGQIRLRGVEEIHGATAGDAAVGVQCDGLRRIDAAVGAVSVTLAVKIGVRIMEHDIVFAAERLRHVVSAVAMRRRRHGSLVFVRRRGQPSVFRRQ